VDKITEGLVMIYGTIATSLIALIAVPVSFRHCAVLTRAVARMAQALPGSPSNAASSGAFHRLRHVG
jgi:hypothetical protein